MSRQWFRKSEGRRLLPEHFLRKIMLFFKSLEVVMDFVFFFAGLISVIVGLFIIKRTSPNKPHGHH